MPANRDEFFAKLAPLDAEQRVTFRRLATEAQSGAARDRQRPGRGGQGADDRPGVTTQEMWNAVADACLAELVRIAGADRRWR
jgi:hypothetical protein